MIEKIHHQLFLRKPLSDRLSAGLSRAERDKHVLLETLALFIGCELSIQESLAETETAGPAIGRDRFEALAIEIGRQVAASRGTPASTGHER